MIFLVGLPKRVAELRSYKSHCWFQLMLSKKLI